MDPTRNERVDRFGDDRGSVVVIKIIGIIGGGDKGPEGMHCVMG